MYGIAHHRPDQADDAVGGQHACGRKTVAGHRGALHVVDRLDQVVDAEGNRRHQNDAEELEAGKHVAERRDRHVEAEIGDRIRQTLERHVAEVEADGGGSPRDERARGNGDQARRNAAVADAAEPAQENDGKARDANHRRHERLQRRRHRDERDRDAGERAEQRRTRRDLPDDRSDEAADHQHEALDEHPRQARLPALDRDRRFSRRSAA